VRMFESMAQPTILCEYTSSTIARYSRPRYRVVCGLRGARRSSLRHDRSGCSGQVSGGTPPLTLERHQSSGSLLAARSRPSPQVIAGRNADMRMPPLPRRFDVGSMCCSANDRARLRKLAGCLIIALTFGPAMTWRAGQSSGTESRRIEGGSSQTTCFHRIPYVSDREH
jgi:hypothetical protein